MYGPLWRTLPGPWWVKALIVLVLVLAIVAVLFMWVFPIVALYMPFNDNTVGAPLPLPVS
ncbi:hypothetical protein MHY20_05145 [Helcobacillus sp. ACRRO]|uniref:hypothetical protein n=1 Tax=Helcobacillus sp. ACRRO TaxID=2918202 RepID=UPI001EF632A5|nr:hypothetical protein [Helcobacillus sp. ACRRO]MCG7427003.1 hypothetical protein [Helcobacillus sp. ACRRO]